MTRDLGKSVLGALCGGGLFWATFALANLRCDDYLEAAARHEERSWQRDSQSPRAWAEHGAEWERTLRMIFRRPTADTRNLALNRLLDAARAGDPRIDILRRLGFVFHDTHIDVPAYDTMMTRYEESLQEQIRTGVIAESDALRPARVFEDAAGNLRFVRFGETPEPGWHLVKLATLPGPVIGRMLAEGCFPATADFRSYHDFGHLSGFLQYPEYARGLRRFFRGMVEGTIDLPRGHREIRAVHALEGLALVPAANRAALGQLLWPTLREAGDRLVTVQQLAIAMWRRPPAELAAHARDVLARFPALVDYYGGSSREIGRVYDGEASLQESFPVLAHRLRNTLRDRPEDPVAIAKDLARLEVALWESTRLSLADYFDGIARFPVPPGSPVHRYFVESGIGQDLSATRPENEHTALSRSISADRRP